MTVTWRPLALAAALIVTLTAAATAQTVIVAKAPPGASIEVGLNAASLRTDKADEQGVAKLPLDTLAAPGKTTTGKTEMDVRVFVDVCEKSRRVWLVETGWQPPAAAAGCTRRELFGVFALQKGTTLVVDAGDQSQAVWIRQGPVPAHWLDPNAQPETTGGPEWPMATGLVLFGGAGAGQYSDSATVACGAGAECSSTDVRPTFRVGAEFWFGRFLAVTGTYLKPMKMEARGYGPGYQFTTTLLPNVATIGGKAGVPIGRVRLYAEGGVVYQRSNLQTIQTMDDITVTVNDESTTFPGGTQEFNLQTSGWSWTVGGGGEIWIKRKWAVYGEVGRAGLKGSPRAGGEGSLDDKLLYVVGGLRFRVGR
jgi:hypothetical protein